MYIHTTQIWCGMWEVYAVVLLVISNYTVDRMR